MNGKFVHSYTFAHPGQKSIDRGLCSPSDLSKQETGSAGPSYRALRGRLKSARLTAAPPCWCVWFRDVAKVLDCLSLAPFCSLFW